MFSLFLFTLKIWLYFQNKNLSVDFASNIALEFKLSSIKLPT